MLLSPMLISLFLSPIISNLKTLKEFNSRIPQVLIPNTPLKVPFEVFKPVCHGKRVLFLYYLLKMELSIIESNTTF